MIDARDGPPPPYAYGYPETPRSARGPPALESYYTQQPAPPRRADMVQSIRGESGGFFDIKVMNEPRERGGKANGLRREKSAPSFRVGLSAEQVASLESAGVKPVVRDYSPWSAGDRCAIFDADAMQVQRDAGEEMHARWVAERRHFDDRSRPPPFAMGREFAAGGSSCSRGPSRGREASASPMSARSVSVHDLRAAGVRQSATPREYMHHPCRERRHYMEERGLIEVDAVRPARRHFPEILAETEPITPRGSGRRRFQEIPGAGPQKQSSGRRHYPDAIYGLTEEPVMDPQSIGRRKFLNKTFASTSTLGGRWASETGGDSRWGVLQSGDAAAGLPANDRSGKRTFHYHRCAAPAYDREEGTPWTATDRGRRKTSTPPMPSTEAMTLGVNAVRLHHTEEPVVSVAAERPAPAGAPQWSIGIARGAVRNEGILGLGLGKRRIDSFSGAPDIGDAGVMRTPPRRLMKTPSILEEGRKSPKKTQPAAGAAPAAQTPPAGSQKERPAWR